MTFRIGKVKKDYPPYYENCPLVVKEVKNSGDCRFEAPAQVEVDTMQELLSLVDWATDRGLGENGIIIDKDNKEYSLTVYNDYIE